VTARRTAVALALIVTAVVLQTTVLADTRLQPFGAAISLVTLVLVGVVRYLDPEVAILVGFTAGLLIDLLGGTPMGIWALTMTVVAFVTVRVRDRADDGPLVVGGGVFLLTFLAAALFVMVSTIFGTRTLTDPSVVRKMILPALYNVVLAAAVLPGITLAMRGAVHKGWKL
jgi:rod shape-determining protein MreD